MIGPSGSALGALVNADPGGTLEKIESAKFANKIWDFRIRAAVAEAMATGDPEEASAVAESIADPALAAGAMIRLVEALPPGHRDSEFPALLDRAADPGQGRDRRRHASPADQ